MRLSLYDPERLIFRLLIHTDTGPKLLMDPMVIITDNTRDFLLFCLSVPSTIHPTDTNSGSTMYPMKTRGKVKAKLNPAGAAVEKKEGKAVKKTRPQQVQSGCAQKST